MKTYTDKSNCRRAARKALGAEAKEGEAFEILASPEGFYWEAIEVLQVSLIKPEPAPAPSPAPAAEMSEATRAMFWEALKKMPRADNAPAPKPAPVEAPAPAVDALAALGATPEALALIAAAAEARCIAPKKPQNKEPGDGSRRTTREAWDAVKAGAMPPPLQVPASNAHVAKRADVLRKLAEEGKLEELQAAVIGGTNTYAKALRSYREALAAYVAGQRQATEAKDLRQEAA